MRALALFAAIVVAACGSHVAAPTPLDLHTATLLRQTFTPAPSSVVNVPQVFSGTATVEIGDRFFIPPALIVSVGTAVTWVNRGQEQHTATARGGVFGSSTLSFGQTYTFTFTKPGIYEYFCANHGDMRGQVEVRG